MVSDPASWFVSGLHTPGKLVRPLTSFRIIALMVLGVKALRRSKQFVVSQEEQGPVAEMQQPSQYVPAEPRLEELRPALVDEEDDVVTRPPSYRASLETLEEDHMKPTDTKVM